MKTTLSSSPFSLGMPITDRLPDPGLRLSDVRWSALSDEDKNLRGLLILAMIVVGLIALMVVAKLHSPSKTGDEDATTHLQNNPVTAAILTERMKNAAENPSELISTTPDALYQMLKP